ncbi:MAG: alanine--tRNA ligase [Oceanococcus sp.]
MISSNEIRRRFIGYFESKGHQAVASSPLVPGNDATLLFTNAGMVQFKDAFLGKEKRSYTRAVSSQRCVRAGGKHNDLENVGYTARHHTFFEMLGNFSFGDYFKREAIQFAWEFLTVELGLPADKLFITVFEKDDEAEAIWLQEMGVDPAKLARIGAKDNFWQMGDTGPCGPCSEIFYDHGPDIAGGPPGTPEEDGDRFIEIWNLVFMQYDRAADGTLTPLPKPSVDTGMGLERVAAVMQHVHDNYDTDQFVNLLTAVRELAPQADAENRSLRVLADHIRACSFLIVDGVLPSNEGRGSVLRRILRRAIRHGFQLGIEGSFFHRLVPALVAEMGQAYPELSKQQAFVEQVIRQEEERFAETLDQGMKLLDTACEQADGCLDGETVFKLYDTYGFPLDLTQDVARERNLTVDVEGFEAAMKQQRESARAASRFGVADGLNAGVEQASEFVGYEQLAAQEKVQALLRDGKPVDSLSAGQDGMVILASTPFYAESGGQVGDTGVLLAGSARFEVGDTRKDNAGAILHIGRLLEGELKAGDAVEAKVDEARRADIIRNHSATHLLHAALRNVLGGHVQQKGSLVAPDRLRFDFAHLQAMSADEVIEVESRVNAEILANHAAETKVSSYQDAVDGGAMALFGEKYGETVRVMRLGQTSCELCGGTHVQRSGDIGLFKIISEAGVAAGVRRIEAVTGLGALAWARETDRLVDEFAGRLKSSRDGVTARLDQTLERQRELEKELKKLKQDMGAQQGGDLADSALQIGPLKLVAAALDGVDGKALREMVDDLKNRLGSAVIVLAAVNGQKVALTVGVSDDQTKAVKAGELVNHVAGQIGGKGGGRPDMAQAGGNQPENLAAALASVTDFVQDKLGI